LKKEKCELKRAFDYRKMKHEEKIYSTYEKVTLIKREIVALEDNERFEKLDVLHDDGK